MMEGIFTSDGVTKSDRNLHTPSDFAKANLLYVQEVGKLQSITPHVCKRNNIDSYLILKVIKGKGEIVYEENNIPLHEGESIWIDCQNEFEHISSADEPWQLVWVHFNGKCAETFYQIFREKNKSVHFTAGESALVEDLIYKIHRNIKDNAPEIKIHGILTQLLVNCILLKNDKDTMKEIREYINMNYKEPELIPILAERFSLKEAEIEELFEKSYGIDIYDYIMNRKFNAAKGLLRFTIEPMNEVIMESGIEDDKLFYTLFEKNENMSPEEYRKKWAQWIKD